MQVRVTCPHYGCGVIQMVDVAGVGQCVTCPNCGRAVPVLSVLDRQSRGLLVAMSLIAVLTWYVVQKAL